MSTDPYPTRSNTSVHLPVALLSLAFAVFLFAQIRTASTQNSILRWQIETAEKQAKEIDDTTKALNQRLAERQPQEAQIEQIRQRYEAMMSDVLELAKEDKDAKTVVEVNGIQRVQPQSGAAAAPAPAAGAPAAAAPAATPAK